MSFKMRIQFEDKTIIKARGKELEDFDPIIQGLKEKFGSGTSRRKKR